MKPIEPDPDDDDFLRVYMLAVMRRAMAKEREQPWQPGLRP